MHNPFQEIRKRPYDEIYIYNIQGEVCDEAEKLFGESYLGNWVEDDSSFLFFTENSQGIISELIERDTGLFLLDHYHFSYEEWQGGEIDTIRVGNLVFTPPWRECKEKTGERRIILDPGVVFGNGLHPTTRNCISALLWLQGISPFQRVLDLGTGTGVLAVSAAALGATEVIALDLNPLAVKTALKNVRSNGFDRIVEVAQGRAEDFINHSGDLVIANLHYDVLRYLFEQKEFLKSKWFIVSGLMRSQALDMKDRIKKQGLEITKEWDHEMTWFTFLFSAHPEISRSETRSILCQRQRK